MRGAWVEIALLVDEFPPVQSLPVRGAWVEIRFLEPISKHKNTSLPVRGAWVEIIARFSLSLISGGRSPGGERGLKSPRSGHDAQERLSLPVRGAWVEMRSVFSSAPSVAAVAPRAGSVG